MLAKLTAVLMLIAFSVSCAPQHSVYDGGQGKQSPINDGRKQEGDGDGTEPATPPPSWDFAFVKEKVLQPYCIGCHQSLANYSAVQKRKDEIGLYVDMGWMPKPPKKLSNFEKKILLDWIDAGAPEFSDTPAPVEP